MIHYWLWEPFRRVHLAKACVLSEYAFMFDTVQTNGRFQHHPWSYGTVTLEDHTVHILLSPYVASVRCRWIAPDPPDPSLIRWHQAILQGYELWIGRARLERGPADTPFLTRLMF